MLDSLPETADAAKRFYGGILYALWELVREYGETEYRRGLGERHCEDRIAKADAEGYRKGVGEVVASYDKRCLEHSDIEYKRGFAAAREKAAGIVAREAPGARKNGYGFVADRYEYLAHVIRAMEVDK